MFYYTLFSRSFFFIIQLKFTVNTENVKITAKVSECSHCLCDNKWHNVVAEFKDNTVTLTVDGWLKDEDKSKEDLGKLEPYSALYIGGYPGKPCVG